MNCPCGILALLFATSAAAQIATPTTPSRFSQREVTGGSSTGTASVNVQAPKGDSTARLVSHYSFGEARQWKSTDGRSLIGKMIAFEDIIIEKKAATAGEAAAALKTAPAPPPPAKFTLLRDGKIRLLVNNKPFEIPLDRLSDEDRAFAKKVDDTVNPKAGSQ
ncbi:MAG: hypothetical protein IPK32_20995 [Verrucomicrobiaceae bacterium]|nr:hypothetical protein [Verrucomicrobiaceae bacterium]